MLTFKAKNPYYFGLLIMSLIVMPMLYFAIFSLYLQPSYGQLDVDNWQTYVDPDKKFTLFYPPGWTTKGKENFLSSIDLTLTNPNATNFFQITITYIVNDSSLNYTGNEIIAPGNNLKNLEGQLKGAYQQYTVIGKGSPAYSVYGFPTASDIVDYTKYNGQTGRMLNVLGIVKGKSSFLLSYSNNKLAFYKSLPIVSEIIKSVVILK
ncbi:MAG: hypothetical protein WAL79_02615 [Nitrososphaeraceae archaeon]